MRPHDPRLRGRILRIVNEAPGLRVSTLALRTGLGRWNARYHVDVLAREGLVVTTKVGPALRIFPRAPRFEERDRQLIARLRAPLALRVVLALLESGESLGPVGLSDACGLTLPQVRYQVRLLATNHVLRVRDGCVSIVEPARVRRLLARAPPAAEELGDARLSWSHYRDSHLS